MQYYTVKDGQAYKLTLRSTGNGTVTSVHTNDLQNMADSLLLSGVPQTYATEVPDYPDHIEGERAVSPFAAVGVFAAIAAVSAIVFFAMKPKKKTKR